MYQSSQKHVNLNPTDNAFLQECRDVFSVFDSDGKGTITQYKLSKVMKAFGWRAEHKELQVNCVCCHNLIVVMVLILWRVKVELTYNCQLFFFVENDK